MAPYVYILVLFYSARPLFYSWEKRLNDGKNIVFTVMVGTFFLKFVRFVSNKFRNNCI